MSLLKQMRTAVLTLGLGSMLYGLSSSDRLGERIDLPFYDRVTSFLTLQQDSLEAAAQKYDLPVDLIAAILYQENDCRPKLQDWKDDALGELRINHSRGVGQVRISTAMRLDGIDFETASREDFDRYLLVLDTVDDNIEYIARELDYIRNQTPRTSGLGVKALLSDTETLDVIASQYRSGLHMQPDKNSYGRNILEIMRTFEMSHGLTLDRRNLDHRIDTYLQQRNE